MKVMCRHFYEKGKVTVVDLNKFIEGKNLTEIEKTVLEYIVDNIDQVLKMGVRGVARANYTSSSTIMRLTKKLEYNGFVDMYYRLLPMIKSSEVIVHEDAHFIDSFSSNKLIKYNSYSKIREFAKKICEIDKKYIFIFGTGFSAMSAEYFNRKLLVLGRKCIMSSGMDSIGVFENNLSDMGMLIVISKSGETKSVVERVKTAKENGIYVVSFTNELNNSVNSLADLPFLIEDSNKLDDRNMAPNTFFPNVLMLIELLVYEYYKVLQSDEML